MGVQYLGCEHCVPVRVISGVVPGLQRENQSSTYSVYSRQCNVSFQGHQCLHLLL